MIIDIRIIDKMNPNPPALGTMFLWALLWFGISGISFVNGFIKALVKAMLNKMLVKKTIIISKFKTFYKFRYKLNLLKKS